MLDGITIETYTHDAIQLLQQMIAIPSYSGEEKKVADLLESFIEQRGYSVSRKGNNIWMLSPAFDTTKPTLLLNSHLDTVKPVAGWTHRPFQPTVVGSKLFGLGSNDAGASVVSLLHVFFALSAKEQPYNLIFAASAEEENAGPEGIVSLLKELPPIDFAVVGEPTEMHLAVAEKGLMVLDCVAYGKAGHAARDEGENAIYKALVDIAKVQQIKLPKYTEFLGPVKMTVTLIQAGSQHNVIPDRCSFVIDVRSNEMYSNQEILELLQSELSSEVTARSTRLGSSATPLNHPFVTRAKALHMHLYGSPTLSDQSSMPFPSVKIGPGHSARSHTANEFIELSEIPDAIEKYVALMDGLSIGFYKR